MQGFVFDLARSRLMEHEWREEFVLSLSHPPPTPYQVLYFFFCPKRCLVLTSVASYAFIPVPKAPVCCVLSGTDTAIILRLRCTDAATVLCHVRYYQPYFLRNLQY